MVAHSIRPSLPRRVRPLHLLCGGIALLLLMHFALLPSSPARSRAAAAAKIASYVPDLGVRRGLEDMGIQVQLPVKFRSKEEGRGQGAGQEVVDEKGTKAGAGAPGAAAQGLETEFGVSSDELPKGLDTHSGNTRLGAYKPQPPLFMKHFPGPDKTRADYREWNHAAMRDLYACIATETCGVHQEKVALLAAHWFQAAVVQGHAQGEGVWGRSIYNTLTNLGYTVLFAVTWEEALYRYRQMPDLIKVVLRNEAGHCHYDPTCVKTKVNPTGIPAWKIFDFEFFAGQSTSMLKGQWLLSPDLDDEPELKRDLQYIGYSIEEDCSSREITPLKERHYRAWLFAKELRYLHAENEPFAWNLSWFRELDGLGVGIAGAIKDDPNGRWPMVTRKETGIDNMGPIGPSVFQHELGMSRVLLGVGAPYLSPSPFVALCQGVPFINPILDWDHDDPENRLKWKTQQPTLRWYDPPIVHNVYKGDHEGFLAAIKESMETEVPRTILPNMRESAMRERITSLMETDWKSKGEALLLERIASGQADIWEM